MIRLIRMLLFFPLYGAFATNLFCQTSIPSDPSTNPANSVATPVQRDSTALAVLQSSFSAMGGSNLSSIQNSQTSIISKSPNSPDDPAATSTITVVGSNSISSVTKNADGTSLSSTLDDSGGTINYPDGTVDHYPRIVYGSFIITHLPLIEIANALSNPAAKIVDLGPTVDGSQQLQEIELSFPPVYAPDMGPLDLPCDIFIDPKTFLILKVVYKQRAPADLAITQELTIRYQNYVPQAGIMIPMQADFYAGNLLYCSQAVTSFAVNVAVDAPTATEGKQ